MSDLILFYDSIWFIIYIATKLLHNDLKYPLDWNSKYLFISQSQGLSDVPGAHACICGQVQVG